MTRREWLDSAAQSLRGQDAPRRSAECMLLRVLAIDRPALARDPHLPVPPQAERDLNALLARRGRGEPLAYVLGVKEFYGRAFGLNPATLIPRPETEHLAEAALARLTQPCHAYSPEDDAVSFLDLGTGSGCLAVTLAAERPSWRGVGVDISAEALEAAQANARRHGVADRLRFLCADFARPGFSVEGRDAWRLVVSNPPYVSEREYTGLDPGVRDFEPKKALVSGENGTELLAAAVGAASRLLEPGGLLLVEHGAEQGEAARSLCPPARWRDVATLKDLAGLDRCLAAVLR